MSEFRVNSITNQDGSAGPQMCGVSTFSGKSGVQIPSGSSDFRRLDGGGRGRGLIGGRYPASPYRTLDFIEIATTGNSQDFGELANQHGFAACFGSNTRAVWAGGYTGGTPFIGNISAVTIASEGDSFDFGDLRQAVRMNTGASDRTRGISFDGAGPATEIIPGKINFINIASGGTDQDFGDSLFAGSYKAGTSNSIRAVWTGTYASPTTLNNIEYVQIQTLGNTVDFGDSTNSYGNRAGATSDTHGGLA